MSPTGFQFVSVSNPAEVASHRKQVRAHAARNTMVRRDNVAKYQSLRQNKPVLEAIVAEDKIRTPNESIRPFRTTCDNDCQDMDVWRSRYISPSPVTLLSPVQHDPFQSFIRPMAPFEGYLLKHFVKHIVMDGVSAKPCMRHLTNQSFELGSGVAWMQESAVDMSMLALTLLVACRSLAKLQHSNAYDPIALRYKVQCLHHLNLALSHEGGEISDMTITKTLVLASEEVFSGNKAAADQHLQAAVHMINLCRNRATVNIWNHDENRSLWSHWDGVTARESAMNVERTRA